MAPNTPASNMNILPVSAICENDSFLENTKNQFLVHLYQGDQKGICDVLCSLADRIEGVEFLTENDEKSVRQVLTAVKQFSAMIASLDADNSIFSRAKSLKNTISALVRSNTQTAGYIHFSKWKNQLCFITNQLDLIFKTTMTLQLTKGCSHFCRRCNEWAIPGIRAHFSFSAVSHLLTAMNEQGNPEISLYGASDPLDWEDKPSTLQDIVDHITPMPMDYGLLTKVPKGKAGLLEQLLKKEANLSVSVTGKNKTRIKRIEAHIDFPLAKQHDSDDLLIAAGLDEDFTTVKPSITDGYGTEITPDGAFIIIPTFTSALHPFGHKKIAVTPSTLFFPEKKTGRHALLKDYFKPLKGYDLNQDTVFLEGLLDCQVESIILDNGTDELTPPGMRSIKEYLSIFDDTARIRRKKMTLSVLKHLKGSTLKNRTFKTLSPDKKENYRKKIKCHLDLCRRDMCAEYKCHALSFFLDAVSRYLKKNQLKKTILTHLLKNEIEQYPSLESNMENTSLKARFANSKIDSFSEFRFWMIRLFFRPAKANVQDFINAYHTVYDPVTDMFENKNLCNNDTMNDKKN